MKKTVSFILAAAAFLFCWVGFRAEACTGLYIGKKCSADGTVIFGRCNDYSPPTIMPYIEIREAVAGVPGRVVKGINGFRWELPENTCRFVAVPYPEISDYGAFSSVAMNEYGVALTATITGYCCREALAADPSVEGGIAEETIPNVLAPCSRTAREAIELLAKVIDEIGSAEQNIIMVADQNEAWYMEIYSGHQYCAVRMPEDAVAVFGNEFMLDTVNYKDKDGVICSENLFKLPVKEGFAVLDENGGMNLRRTYGGDGRFYDFSHLRTWGGHRLLSPTTVGDYEHDTYYPLFFRPDGKVSLEQVMELFRDRYFGTKYNPEENDAWQNRVIGDESQEEVHIVQVRDDLPASMACVTWLTLSEAAHAPFVPVSSAITDCNPSYKYCAQDWGYHKDQAQHIYKRINSICAQNRSIYSKGVKDYWKIVEEHMMDEFEKVSARAAETYSKSPSEAGRMLTDYCTGMQDDCIADAERIFDEMMWHMMVTTRTNPYEPDFTDLVTHPAPQPAFTARFDVARFAGWEGWNSEYSEKDRTVILTREGRVVRVRANGEHRTELGSITEIDAAGNEKTDRVDAVLSDGRILLPLTCLDRF